MLRHFRPRQINANRSLERSIKFVSDNRIQIRCAHSLDAFLPKDSNHHVHEKKQRILDFNNPQSAHGWKSNTDLLRSLVVYRTCRFPFILKHAATLLALSYKVFGSTITNVVVKATFFDHFCAGENVKSLKPKLESMQKDGVGGILDYAAEADVLDDNLEEMNIINQPLNQPARMYEYKSEHQCDLHVETFKSCIRAVRNCAPQGFAAVKVTALGNPVLLERVANAITQIKELFYTLNTTHDGRLTLADFEDGIRLYFGAVPPKFRKAFIQASASNDTKTIDYVRFSNIITPQVLPQLTANLVDKESPLFLSTPTPEEIQLLEAAYARAHTLAQIAVESKVRLLFDAEQSYYQPVIDSLVLNLQETYNHMDKTDHPIIFHTYQCYLKDTLCKLEMDVRRASRESYHFGAKMVRGAYMHSERERAKQKGYPSPIHDTIEDTHACYDQAIDLLLRYRQQPNAANANLEIMCASHNQESIEKLIKLMDELDMHSSEDTDAVHFAQLLGMSDNLTYSLGQYGLKSYKYVPYGKVDEVMPYLMRRLEENSNAFGNVGKEEEMIWMELKRRTSALGFN